MFISNGYVYIMQGLTVVLYSHRHTFRMGDARSIRKKVFRQSCNFFTGFSKCQKY
jgi:hypothetical protein